jgi:hypothetical protein
MKHPTRSSTFIGSLSKNDASAMKRCNSRCVIVPFLGFFHDDAKEEFMSKQAAEHHHQAAEHHEHAARHHKEAAKHHEAGSHELAGHHAHLAHGHHEHASHHAAEAAKAHIEHHAKASSARA